jgi:hypothetical protein
VVNLDLQAHGLIACTLIVLPGAERDLADKADHVDKASRMQYRLAGGQQGRPKEAVALAVARAKTDILI